MRENLTHAGASPGSLELYSLEPVVFRATRPNGKSRLAISSQLLGGVILNGCVLLLPAAVLGVVPSLLADGAAQLLLLLATLFCAVELWLVLGQPRVSSSPTRDGDRQAFWLATATGLLILMTFWGGLWHRADGSPACSAILQALGSLGLLSGTILRAIAIARLGDRFRTEVSVDATHRLLQHGIYGWIRHPSETGLLLATLGICLLTGWYAGLALWLGGLVPLSFLRVRLEEHHLESVHGDVYRQYARRVRRFIPLPTIRSV